LTGLNHCAKEVLAFPDYYPEVDTTLYPHTNIHRPSGDTDTNYGGWAWKATIKCTKPKSNELKGKTFAIKDSIAVAGVKCTNGMGGKLGEWVPNVDATIVTSILDAGGVILGKGVCEAGCLSAVSDTASTGNVHNFHAHGYSTGGSCSGNARLISSGQVDMAVDADQGGSIRKPSANCGVVVVGMKSTWDWFHILEFLLLKLRLIMLDQWREPFKTVRRCWRLLRALTGLMTESRIIGLKGMSSLGRSSKNTSTIPKHLSKASKLAFL
jgi:amidase